ncbi:MAG: glutamate-5-semialdehyde dehydrogenase [Alphaproteobacteria bacterium]
MTATAARQTEDSIETEIRRIGAAAKEAGRILGLADGAAKDDALRFAAAAIRMRRNEILDANRKDLAHAESRNLSESFRDRLTLTEDRIERMAAGLEDVAGFPDPIGRVLDERVRPNGLRITRVSVPIGVIGIIYESRPNVTADAGGLCIKSGNAAILRGGSDSLHSSSLIADCLRQGLRRAGLPEDCVQLVQTRDRSAVGAMLRMHEFIDIIVPRGGRSLIERVMAETKIPVIAHLEGICHVYVDAAAQPQMARDIVLNAKMRRTGVCGAAETLLIDRSRVAALLPAIVDDLTGTGCVVRGDEAARQADPRIAPASEADWTTEYLDAIISVKVVDGVRDAIAHINRYGSNHTDMIVTDDYKVAELFLAGVDSAIVMHNASTQFADGGEFGMGAEIGISTGKLHARGPVGAEQLTTFKYVVRGDGQIRP